MRILLAVDVQKEFAKDAQGKNIYNKLIPYLREAHTLYDQVIALVYENTDNVNIRRFVKWTEMQQPENLEFKADAYYFHAGYCPLNLPPFNTSDRIYVVGFDTDACVLSTCFSLFNNNNHFTILSKGCWSSGGKRMHQAGLTIMRRQFGSALDMNTDTNLL